MPLQISGGSLLLPLRIDGYAFDRVGYTGSVDERVSTQLQDQLPGFVTENYDTFVQFLKAYYEWSEQYGNPRGEGVRLTTYSDVDTTLDNFIQYFRDTYIKDFPFALTDGINEKTLLKNIGDLYNAKGTRASFDLLFRILFNTTIDIDFPKDRILKVSTSTFDDRQYVRIPPILTVDEAQTIENSLIVQKYAGTGNIIATAIVDEVNYISEGGLDFFSLLIQNVSGEFVSSLPIEIKTTGITQTVYYANPIPTLAAMTINAGGTGYEIGDTLEVFDLFNNKLLDAKVNSIGTRKEVRGFNYTNNYGVYRSGTGITYTVDTASGAGLSLSPSAEAVLTDGPDDYLDETGKLSSRSFIQDSFFFQDYSYTIKVNKSLSQFADAVRKLVHPSGTLMFAEFINEVSMTASGGLTANSFTKFQPLIGHYLPHTFGTTIDPRGFTYTSIAGSTHYDFYPIGWNGQDGRTAEDFFSSNLASSVYGTPHIDPSLGITHNPYNVEIFDINVSVIYPLDSIETERILVNGAIGSTGYIGATVDGDGQGVGLYGFFPVGSSRTNTINSDEAYGVGVTHYGGYTCPQDSGSSGGYSGGQIIQVVGTDIPTADYWIVYRHVNSLGLNDLGTTGSNDIFRIPMEQTTAQTQNNPVIGDRSGYSLIEFSPPSLSGGGPYLVGEIVRQKKHNEPEAIGRVIGFDASAHHQGLLTPYYNIGVDHLSVEVLNGRFIKNLDSTGVYRPIVGDTTGVSRLIDQSYIDNINTSVTHDTSWMDVPISIMTREIEYSNLTN